MGFQRAVTIEQLDPNLNTAVEDSGGVRDRPRTRYERTMASFALAAFGDTATPRRPPADPAGHRDRTRGGRPAAVGPHHSAGQRNRRHHSRLDADSAVRLLSASACADDRQQACRCAADLLAGIDANPQPWRPCGPHCYWSKRSTQQADSLTPRQRCRPSRRDAPN